MFTNFFKIAIRTLLKNKIMMGITLFGLSIGLTCCILISLYVRHEFSVDQFHEKSDRLFRSVVHKHHPESGSSREDDWVYDGMQKPDLLQTYKDNNESVIRASRFQITEHNWIKADQKMRIEVIANADEDFFKMFSFPLAAGSVESALNTPNSIILSEELASFLFSDVENDYQSVIGRRVAIPTSQQHDFVVSAVMRNLNKNSSMQFSAVTRFEARRGMGGMNN